MMTQTIMTLQKTAFHYYVKSNSTQMKVCAIDIQLPHEQHLKKKLSQKPASFGLLC